MAKMEFGVGLGAELRFDEAAKHAQVADVCGFSHASFVDQSNVSREVHGMMTLAALNTSRILIGQGLTDPSMYHPAVIANFIASLRELSEGRAFVGIGAGSPRAGRAMIKSTGLQALRDTVTFIRKFTAGEDAELWGHTWHSEWIRSSPWAGRAVSVFMGPIGPRSLQLAGEIADDIWVFGAGDTEFMKWNMEQIEKGAIKAGRDPTSVKVWARTEIYLDDSLDKARKFTASYAASCAGGVYSSIFKHNTPEAEDLKRRLENTHPGIVDEFKRIVDNFNPYKHEAGDAPHARFASDRVIDFFNLTGTVETVVEKVHDLVPLGVYGVSCVQYALMDQVSNMKNIAEQIMPHYRN